MKKIIKVNFFKGKDVDSVSPEIIRKRAEQYAHIRILFKVRIGIKMIKITVN